MSTPRITPLEPPYPEPVQAALDRIMPKGVPPLALTAGRFCDLRICSCIKS